MAEKRNLSTALAIASLVALAAIGIAATVAPSSPPQPAATVVNPKIPRMSDIAGSGDPKFVEELRKGGYVIFFRHGATDWGQRDQSYTDFENRATQRNLSDAGKAQAAEIGKAFGELGVPIESVFVSPMWRCRDTAEIAFGAYVVKMALFGKVATAQGVPSSVSSEERTQYRTERIAMLGTEPKRHKNLILVGQQDPMIPIIPGLHRDELREGDALVIRPKGKDKFEVVVQVTPADWTRLAAAYPAKK